MFTGGVGVVVNDHGCTLAQGIGPNTSLAHRVMVVIGRRAVGGQRGFGPSHQLYGFLVFVHQMDESDLTVGEFFGQFLAVLHEGAFAHGFGGCRQIQQRLRQQCFALHQHPVLLLAVTQRLCRGLRLRQRVLLLLQRIENTFKLAAYQRIQQQRCDRHKQPAFNGADVGKLNRIGKQPDHEVV